MKVALLSHNQFGHAIAKFLHGQGKLDTILTIRPDKATNISDHATFNDILVPAHAITDINTDGAELLRQLKPDVLLVTGWSQIIKDETLQLVPRTIGTHPSLLPRYRGRAAIPWQILDEEEHGGITFMHLRPGHDTDASPILQQAVFDITPADDASSLYQKATDHAIAILNVWWDELLTEEGTPQDHDTATTCARRTPDDGRIDWTMEADTIARHIRAVTKPYPGAHGMHKGERHTFWKAAVPDENKHIGMPGQIVSKDADGILVSCGPYAGVCHETIKLYCDPTPYTMHERLT